MSANAVLRIVGLTSSVPVAKIGAHFPVVPCLSPLHPTLPHPQNVPHRELFSLPVPVGLVLRTFKLSFSLN